MFVRSFSSATGMNARDLKGDDYLLSRYSSIQDDADLSPYAEIPVEEIENYISETLIQEHGYSEEDIDYLLHFNSNVAVPSEYENGGVIPNITKYFIDKLGSTVKDSKEILLRFPRYMNIDTKQIDERIAYYTEVGISNREITTEEISEIFRANPFYLICPQENYQRFINEFNHYRFSKEETIRMFKEQPGIFGLKKGNIRALFETPKVLLGVKASDMKEIILRYPEFILQGRKNIIVEKIKIVMKNSNSPKLYLRDLFLRHPKLFLKSYASFKAKESFFIIELGRGLKTERSWPLMLKMNYNAHIRPRCALAYNQNFEFDITEALIGTDEEFCKKFGFTIEQLDEERSSHEITEEKDIL
eukprot:CAMPEP_0197005804 /NCGR_PEP_ID=MMETSP1380-20130617/31376_1 /TAXON_ID=5936 /ORGANISM="Euplotes crassus, Strain CT5" /LENGTH=359 /DNA_ID=CAMNT_0042425077 /DNA_START=38 /DNA_END=1114 /DNA_ORIENTATION=+